MRVNNIFNYSDDKVSIDVGARDRNYDEQIDNSAQILNVSMPTEGHEESRSGSPPMKLKPQFWSKFTKTTTLPVKD